MWQKLAVRLNICRKIAMPFPFDSAQGPTATPHGMSLASDDKVHEAGG